MWIVSGDKDSTALSIGYQCGILDRERSITHVTTADSLDRNALLRKITENGATKDLMISGTALQAFIDLVAETKEEERRQKFVNSFLDATGYVVYRSSPLQKAILVKFVRENCPGQTTLAIGDGANDVNMIQTAHVGVGILGKEGRQASSFADFAIGKFKYLRRLLFWHGSQFGFNICNFIDLII